MRSAPEGPSLTSPYTMTPKVWLTEPTRTARTCPTVLVCDRPIDPHRSILSGTAMGRP